MKAFGDVSDLHNITHAIYDLESSLLLISWRWEDDGILEGCLQMFSSPHILSAC